MAAGTNTGDAAARRGETEKAVARFFSNRTAAAGLIVLGVIVIVTILPGLVTRFDPIGMDLPASLQAPSAEHPLGTDSFGRDVLSRVLHGGRVSLGVGLTARTISLILGLLAGTIAGYFGGRLDNFIMRLADITFAFPTLLLLIAIMAVVTPGMGALSVALGAVGWAAMARLVRAQILSIRGRDYVQAARAAGAGHLKLIVRYILPQCLSPLVVVFTLGLGMTIMAESSLSFLGLGIQPPHPSWGGMISRGIPFMRTAPWLTILPGLVLTLVICSINLVGDGLRDALDPRRLVPPKGGRK
ncbi:MAG: ABC transporter permease [Candidatus Krumholzibacteria bacterium]|nr:ABC transporter permease [Candidatus Krumholzibacteria bacterium]